MQILMVAAENGIISGAKVGGVADVIRDVPIALAAEKQSVDIVIPDHGNFHQKNKSVLVSQLDVSFRGEITQVSLYQLYLTDQESGNRQYIVAHDSFSQENGQVYYHDYDKGPFASDANKFALFSLAVCEFMLNGDIKRPDILHLHDWHTATISVLLTYDLKYQKLETIKRIYSIHNIALQGIRPFNQDESSLEAWFPQLSYNGELICDPQFLHCYNPMRAGINLNHKVHVVSPNYCLEILQESNHEQGFFGGEGLEGDLRKKHANRDVIGVLNGCDYESLDVQQADYSMFLGDAKKALLRFSSHSSILEPAIFIANERINQWMNHTVFSGPLVTNVGRLTSQKVSLLFDGYQHQQVFTSLLAELELHQGRFILIGSGDKVIEKAFTQFMATHDNFLFINGYDEALSSQLYALGDLFFMPSSFEPCGISQMLAMKHGQPCLVNDVGGLTDTVKHNENGFVFSGNNKKEKITSLIKVFQLALDTYCNHAEKYQTLADSAKSQRFSWKKSINEYIEKLYQ